jgi:hypothetical protein
VDPLPGYPSRRRLTKRKLGPAFLGEVLADASIPAGPLRGHISTSLSAAGVASADLELVARWGVDHCPVVDAVRRAIPVTVDIETEPIGPA